MAVQGRAGMRARIADTPRDAKNARNESRNEMNARRRVRARGRSQKGGVIPPEPSDEKEVGKGVATSMRMTSQSNVGGIVQ